MIPDQQTREPVGLSGGRLADGFNDFRSELQEEDKTILDSVLELVDWVGDIRSNSRPGSSLSPNMPRTRQVLKFIDRFMQADRNTLTAYDASEGVLYVLFCAMLCLSRKAPTIFSIDNLDQALNPRIVTGLPQNSHHGYAMVI